MLLIHLPTTAVRLLAAAAPVLANVCTASSNTDSDNSILSDSNSILNDANSFVGDDNCILGDDPASSSRTNHTPDLTENCPKYLESRRRENPDGIRAANLTAQDAVCLLNLKINIEGGFYAETFRDKVNVSYSFDPATIASANRSASTAIYYLIRASDEFSFWHAVDAVEVWHFYAGDPLTLELSWNDAADVAAGARPDRHPTSGNSVPLVLGNDLFAGHRPQIVIPAGQWQRVRSEGWTLVGTTVAPGFTYNGGFVLHNDTTWKPDGTFPNATFHA